MSKTWDIRGARGANDQIVTVATVHELEYHGEWMVEEFVTVTIVSATPVELRYGDFLDYRGERFYIDYDPSVIKKSSSGSYGEAFTYDNVKLYSSARQLNDTSFRDVVLNDNKLHTAMSVFAFFASSVEDLADRIQANLYRSSSDQWVVFTPNKYRWLQRKPSFVQESVWDSIYGSSDPSAIVGNRDINVECQNLSCTGALVLSYNKFNVPYIVRGHSIIIGAPAVDAGRIFKYGLGNGLYEIERTGEDQQLVTKLYAYGSEENLPLNYYANLHKKTVVKGVRDAKNMGQGLTYYGLKTNTPWGDVRNGLLNADSMCMLSYGGMTMKTFFDPMVYDEEGEAQYLYVRFDHDATTDHDEEFYNALGDGEVTITVTGGANINSWPSSLIVNEAQDNYPALLSINKLMLPGFPDMSLNDFVHGAANGDFIMPGYDDLNTSMRVATSLLAHYTFSGNITEPWIKSHLSGTVGLKEGNLYFDGTNNLDDIKPTIEDTGADVVTEGSTITDNGYLADNADASFYLTVASNSVIDWQVAYTKRTEDISLEMKTGYCTGRKFKLLAEPESVDGGWKLKLEREKDTSTSRYFPYRESDTGSYAQVLAGDKFVVTGIDLPKGYVEAASVRLLIAACRELGKIDHPSRTYLPKIDEIYMQRQDDEAKASGGTIESLHDRLKAGMTLSMLDTDLEISVESTIDVITIKENGNNGIPTYDVVLRNDKEKNLATTVQDQIDKTVAQMPEPGMTDMQLEAILDRLGEKLFISKRHEDSTEYLVTFFAGIIADKLVQSPDFLKGVWTRDEETGEEHNDGEGFSIYKSGIGDWHIEIDWATVRNLMRAKEIYTQTAHIGEVTNQTIFRVGLQTLGNILLGHYAEGVEGGIITPEGHVEINTLITRGLAKLQELFVVNDSTFGGNLSSIEFISGFLGGKGWAIQKKKRINSAGVEEEYFALEIDNVTVRNTLRVYELVVSQLRGEFDNYVFAACMEVHHYDPLTGRVWLYTEAEKIRAIPYREGDYIMCQQYVPGNDYVSGGTGYITKHYEFIVTDCGTGGQTDEDGFRLDWVTFKNFTTDMQGETALSLIGRKDTICRVDNESDPERKGLMQIITVGPNTPYLDVIYGLKTDPNDYLKVRIGNLQGVHTETFGWLEDYGAYMPNFYGVGKLFYRHSGSSLNADFELTKEHMKSLYTETTYNFEGENLLKNGYFSEGLSSWTSCAVGGGSAPAYLTQQAIDSGNGTPLMMNGAVLAYQNRLTVEVTEYEDIRVLHILGMGLYQNFSDITANTKHKEPKSNSDQSPDYTEMKDVEDRLYMGIRMIPLTSGTLSVTFMRSNGTVIASWSRTMNASLEWELVQAMDSAAQPWAYTGQSGRMIVSYTGECYIRFVALQNDPVSSNQETYSTMFEMNSRTIRIQAAKQTADLNQAVAEIEVEFDHVRTTVTNNKTAADKAFQQVNADLLAETQARINAINAEAAARGDFEDYYYSTWVYQNDNLISLMAAQFNSDGTIKGYADLKVQVNQISSTVTDNYNTMVGWRNGLQNEIDAEEAARKSADDAQDTVYATFRTQTEQGFNQVAARMTVDGEIRSMSWMKQYADSIETSVESYADGKVGELRTKVNSDISTINTSITNLNTKITNVDTENDDRAAAYATWKGQTDKAITSIAAKWDAQGNLIGYSTTQQTASAISSAVGDGVTAAEKYTDDLKALINTDVLKDGSGNYAYMTFKNQTNTSISQIAAKWDTQGNLINYSTTQQTASAISSAVGDGVTAAEKYTDALKALINTDVLKDGSGNYAYMTFKNQTNTSITSIAAKWDAQGNLINYSTTEQTEAMIKTKVESYGYQTASQVNGLISNHTKWNSYTTLEQTDSKITSTVTAKYISDKVGLTDYAKKTELPDMSLYYNKSAIDQMEDNITASVARVEQKIVSISDVSMWEQGAINYSASVGTLYDNIKTDSSTAVRYKSLVGITTETSFLISSGFIIRLAYFDKNNRLKRVGSALSPNKYGIVNASADSSEPYVAVIIARSQGGAITPANVTSTGISVTKDNVVTSAYLSLYVDKNSVSWLTGSADNVIFNFSNVFQIQHNQQAVMELDGYGNLYITGELKANSTIGTVLPMKVDGEGNLMRKTVDGTWIANYAGRFVKYKNFVRNGDTFEMRPGDDLLLSNGNYDPKNVYLPLNPANGKVITIKNIGGKTVIRPAKNSTQKIRMTDVAIDYFDLNTYDRIEFVFYEGTWWGNVSPI